LRLDEATGRYLSGAEFSNGRHFSIPASPPIERDALLVEMARGKRVLHVGCADHLEIIDRKIADGRYLHAQLERSAASLIGCDTNERSMAHMRAKGFRDLFLPQDVPEQAFDVVLVPDVIEHVPNVGSFLGELKRYRAGSYVITTPNAFRFMNRLYLTSELVNSDHRYWFSPYTLARVCVDAGFRIRQMRYTDTIARRNLVRRFFTRRYPLTRNGLAIELSLDEA
jgi:2-polyprenyl-3-methyl-5-hydroxy-6-metoxy-1,4-benzoquinol methylase